MEILETYNKINEKLKKDKIHFSFDFKYDKLYDKPCLFQIKKENIWHLLGIEHINQIYNFQKGKNIDIKKTIKLIEQKQINNEWIEKISWNNHDRQIKQKANYILNKLDFWDFFINKLGFEFNFLNPEAEIKFIDIVIKEKLSTHYNFVFDIKKSKKVYIWGWKYIKNENYKFNLFIPVTIIKIQKREEAQMYYEVIQKKEVKKKW